MFLIVLLVVAASTLYIFSQDFSRLVLKEQEQRSQVFFKKNAGGGDPHMITVARQALISGRSLLSHQLQPASINQSSKANRPQLTNPQVGQMLKASS